MSYTMAIIHHVGFHCKDVKKQKAFYEDVFGYKCVKVFKPGQPDEFYMLRSGESCLELFPVNASPDARGGEQAVGFKHLAFEVDDLDAMIAKVETYGIKVGEKRDCGAHVPGLVNCFFDDLEGNIIEMLIGWTDDPNAA